MNLTNIALRIPLNDKSENYKRRLPFRVPFFICSEPNRIGKFISGILMISNIKTKIKNLNFLNIFMNKKSIFKKKLLLLFQFSFFLTTPTTRRSARLASFFSFSTFESNLIINLNLKSLRKNAGKICVLIVKLSILAFRP